jgi:hypothetical protein
VCNQVVDDFRDQRFDENVFDLPFVVYQVIQASKSGKYKNRLVYCPPFKITVLETIFGAELTESFLGNNESSIFVGHRQTDIYNLVQDIKMFNKYSGDYSSYDQTIPSFIIA